MTTLGTAEMKGYVEVTASDPIIIGTSDITSQQSAAYYATVGIFTSDFASLNAAVAAIGTADATLVVNNATTITANLTIGSNITLRFERAGFISGAYTLTLNCLIDAGVWQIFATNVDVVFSWNAGTGLSVKVAWFGAIPDNSTSGATNSTAIANAIASLPTANAYPTLIFEAGRYKIAGATAVHFNTPMRVIGNDTILDYESGTGTAVQIGAESGAAIAPFYMSGVHVTKTAGVTGTAATDLVGIGMLLQNVKNFYIERPAVSNFKYGMKFYGLLQGASYGTITAPVIVTNLIGTHFDSSDNTASFCTEITFIGGRISFDTTTYDTMAKLAGTRLIEVAATNTFHRHNGFKFIGTNLENTVERKVLCDGDAVAFTDNYWDAGSHQGNASTTYYAGSITGASSANGSAVITKAAHGLYIVDNDLVLITSSSTGSDRGSYRVVSSDAGTITLDKNLYGTETDVELTVYRTNLEFSANSTSCQVRGGNNFAQQAVVDMGTRNSLDDPERGYSRGSIAPTQAISEYSQIERSLQQLREDYAGAVSVYYDNMYDDATSARILQDFRTMDDYNNPRVGSRIEIQKLARDDRGVRHRMLFRNAIGGAYNINEVQSFSLGLNYDDDGSMAKSQSSVAGVYRGIVKEWVYQADSMADDATIALPDATSGFITVSANGECATFVVETDGTVTKVSGTTNTAATDSDTDLCVYDSGTGATLKNRLGTTAEVRAVYNYN